MYNKYLKYCKKLMQNGGKLCEITDNDKYEFKRENDGEKFSYKNSMGEIFKITDIKNYPLIGKGAHGEIRKVLTNENKTIVVKEIYTKEDNGKDNYQTNTSLICFELEILRMLNTSEKKILFPELYGYYVDKTNLNTLIFMEYISGIKFFFSSKYISGEKIFDFNKIVLNLTSGLEFIHSKNIVHNDIKNDNIMIDNEYNVKIMDFGISCLLSNEDNCCSFNCGKKYLGTPNYSSFDYIYYANGDDKDNMNEIMKKNDMWCLGITIYYFLFGKILNEDEKEQDNPNPNSDNDNKISNIINRFFNPKMSKKQSEMVILSKGLMYHSYIEYKDKDLIKKAINEEIKKKIKINISDEKLNNKNIEINKNEVSNLLFNLLNFDYKERKISFVDDTIQTSSVRQVLTPENTNTFAKIK